jgi:hypothetical protein
MRVRLAAEEYSEYAPICDRTPARCAHLLRRGLRVPLACCAGDRPRNSVRLRGHALQAGVAYSKPARLCSGSACAPIHAGDAAGRGEGRSVSCSHRRRVVCRKCRATRLRNRSAARRQLPASRFGVGLYEAAGSSSAAAELAAIASSARPTTEPATAALAAEPATGEPAAVLASALSPGRQVGG